MQRFAGSNDQVTAARLLEQCVGTVGTIPQAFLCTRNFRIYCVHNLSKYQPAFDGSVTPWDDGIFGFLGDVTSNYCTSVRLPPEVLRPIQLWAFTAEYMRTHLGELDAAPGVFGIPPPGHEQASAFSVRGMMILPSRYAPLLLQGRGYTPREVWNLLLPLIIDDDKEEECRPLIDWLRAATTTSGLDPQTNRPMPPPFTLNFTGPPVDEDLILHRSRIMKLLLPGLSHLSDGLENAITSMATAIVQQTDEARTSRENKQIEDEMPKLPSAVEKFKHTLHILLCILNIDDEANLPVLWHEWANCGKKQELAILRDLLDNYVQSPDRFIAKAPIVTPRLVQDIISFNFIGDHRDEVSTGISPFNVIDGGEAHRKHNLDLSKVQGTLYQNEVGFTLSDLDALQKRELRAVPLCYFDLEKSLGIFGNLLGVVLGNGHAITTAYRQFWNMLTLTVRDDIRDQIDVQYTLRPAHLIRSVQLITYTWFSTRRANGVPPIPNFVDILLRIQMASYQLPGLPGIYHELTYAIKTPTTTTPLTSLSSGGHSSDLSTISGSFKPEPLVTGHGGELVGNGGGGRQLPPPTRNVFVRNTAPDAELQALIPTHLQLRTVIKNDAVPNNDANLPMCLSFHLRRGCWSQCKRSHDHNRTLSTGEKQRVAAFVTAQLTKLSTALSTPGMTATRTIPPATQDPASGSPSSRG